MSELPGPSITPGIRVIPVRSPTLPPATHTNLWVLGHERLTLVDPASPWPEEHARLDALLATWGVVERIVLTHHHHDHHQDTARLAAAHDVPVFAHPATIARLPHLELHPLDHLDELQTDAGPLVAHHTPGHAPGHLILQTPQGPIVAGDLVAGVGTIAIDPDDDGHLATYLDSLAAMRQLRGTALLPAHGPVLRAPDVTIDHYIAHRNARTAQFHDALVEGGPLTPLEVARRVYVDLDPRFHPLAAVQVRAHLHHLEERGAVVCEDGVWSVRPV